MGLLACQHDATARSGTFTLLSCQPREDGRFDLVLDDSLIYPEGGGQPADHGQVEGVAVVDSRKLAQGVWHLALGPVAPGPVRVAPDWARRFDHMQQHSAQHLLSALAQDRLGLATIGFHLGDRSATIDLDGPLSEADRDRLQAMVAEQVRQALPVQVELVDVAAYAGLPVRSRGLPEGHDGPIRLVRIGTVDLNTCGGTHVSSTAELELVHIARLERNKSGTRLHFLAGGRAARALDEARDRDRALSERLTCPPERFVEALERLQEAVRDAARRSLATQAELAGLLGEALGRRGGVQHLHRPEADLLFLQQVGEAALGVDAQARLVLTAGSGQGLFLLLGPEDWVARAGPLVAAAVDGRGGGRGGRFQGKGARIEAAAEVLHSL